MKTLNGYTRGMGIGGWLTNYKRLALIPPERRRLLTIGDFEHFQTYITDSDVKNIASFGMDHIRLGFDQVVVEDAQAPYTYRETIFELIDRFIESCKRENINVVLNLHKAIGCYCDFTESVSLFEDAELKNRFIRLWVEFEKRYHTEKNIVFELMNEVSNTKPELWNNLATETISEIRKLNPDRKIIIGSTNYNSANTLNDLKVFEDENIIYTFHFYDPFEFTHQRGVLQSINAFYNREMPYPSDIERYRDFRTCIGDNAHMYDAFPVMDKTYLESALSPTLDFIKAHSDKILYCGEFGTIRHCNINSRINWFRDVIHFLLQNEIPYCVWNYLSTPYDGNRFSLVDDDTRQILSKELLSVIRGE